jgi:hypothetical protein
MGITGAAEEPYCERFNFSILPGVPLFHGNAGLFAPEANCPVG